MILNRPPARELDVGLVAYSPLGRGFLTGTVDVSTLAANDGRRHLSRFSQDADIEQLDMLATGVIGGH